MGYRIFPKALTTEDVTRTLEDIMANEGVRPGDIVFDKGPQFFCEEMRQWCKDNGIDWRYGKVGEHGSVAVIERYFRTLKTECTRRILVPNVLEAFDEELKIWVEYFNAHRPHSRHDGKTPDEVYFNLPAANSEPRFEPRPRARDHTPCARPRTMIDTRAGAKVRIKVSFYKGRQHLPILSVV